MYNALPYKTKQFLFFLVKISIVVGSFYFIYSKIVHNEHVNFQEFIEQLEQTIFSNPQTIVILVIFTIANWFFEILKWETLASFIQKTSFFEALQQSLGSLTASLFTPNRIGEYGAKAIYYQKGSRRKIMLLNLIGNMAQMTVTVIFGAIGLFYFLSHFEVDINFHRSRRIIYVLAMLVIFILTGSVKGRKKIGGFYIDKIKNFIKKIPLAIHAKVALFAILKYLIFSHQFYYLLRLFGVETDYTTLMALITSMYLIASVVPSLALLDFLIRGSVAIWIFSFIGINELVIVVITLMMWLLNFGLPGMIGSYFVLNFNLSTNK